MIREIRREHVSQGLREAIIKELLAGERTPHEIARDRTVSVRTVYRLWRQYRTTGDVQKKVRPHKITSELRTALKDLLCDNSKTDEAVRLEILADHGIDVSVPTIKRARRRCVADLGAQKKTVGGKKRTERPERRKKPPLDSVTKR